MCVRSVVHDVYLFIVCAAAHRMIFLVDGNACGGVADANANTAVVVAISSHLLN